MRTFSITNASNNMNFNITNNPSIDTGEKDNNLSFVGSVNFSECQVALLMFKIRGDKRQNST